MAKILDVDGCAVCEGVAGVDDGGPWATAHDHGPHGVVIELAGFEVIEGDVDGAGLDEVDGPFMVAASNLDEAGAVLAFRRGDEASEQGHHDRLVGESRHGKACRRLALYAACLLVEHALRIEDLVCKGEQRIAGLGEAHGRSRPLEQRQAQFLLERDDVLAQRWLGHVEHAGCFRDVQPLGQLDELVEGADIQSRLAPCYNHRGQRCVFDL